MRLPCLLCVVACLGFSSAGCLSTYANTCTPVACSDGFGVEFEKATTPWEDGGYVIEVDTDGTVNTCTVTFPMASTADSVVGCTDMNIELAVGSTTDAGTTQGFGVQELRIWSAPKNVTVTVLRDRTQVVTKAFTPVYQTVQLGGACSPKCSATTDAMAVP